MDALNKKMINNLCYLQEEKLMMKATISLQEIRAQAY